jgi:hypothetical protein
MLPHKQSGADLEYRNQPNPPVAAGSANDLYLNLRNPVPAVLERTPIIYPNDPTAVPLFETEASLVTVLTNEPPINITAKADTPVQQIISTLGRAIIPVVIGLIILGIVKTKS